MSAGGAGARTSENRMQKILVVTGGSSGIGAATVRLAAERGYAVCVNYLRDTDAAQQLVAEVRERGQRAIAVAADVSVEADVLRLFAEVDGALGPVTALVNNAGILERQARVEQLEAERIMRVLATNVLGSFLCAREALRRMSRRFGGNGGGIVNLSSVAARFGAPNEYVDYAASKGAIESFTRGLATEVGADGVRVNAVRPGLIYTDIHAQGGEPGRVDRLKETLPMRRGGQPEEVAEAILWLLSDAASYTTGTILDVTGGR